MKAKVYFIVFLFLLSSIVLQDTLKAQFLSNPGLEGPTRDNYPPDDWDTCGFGSSPDSPPNDSTGVFTPPYEGERYMSLRTRGPDQDSIYDETLDMSYTQLLKPFEEGNCYIFYAHLAMVGGANYAPAGGSKPTSPVKFQVFGLETSNVGCENRDLLAETEPVTDTAWTQYRLVLFPEKDYHYIMLRSYYANEDSTYHGMNLVDNIIIREGGEQPAPYVVMDTVVPYETTLELVASEGLNYSWEPPDNLECSDCRDPYVIVREEEEYHVLIKQDSDSICYIEDVFNIKLETCETTSSVTRMDEYLNIGDEVTLEASESRSYSWIPAQNLECDTCQSIHFIVNGPIEYQCEIQDDNGCTINEHFIIRVKMDIPNVFTPNGDGINDCFVIQNLPEGSRLKIFDRNGVLQFESSDYRQNWDGKNMNRKPMHQDNYWYVLQVPFSEEVFQGSVYLKRD